MMRSAVPQDPVGQQKVHGCEGSCEVTSARIPDRPETDLSVVLHQDVLLILVQQALQIPHVEVLSHFAPVSSFSVFLQGKLCYSSFLLPQKEDGHMGIGCCSLV